MHDNSQLDLILNEFFLGLVESILNLMDLSLEVPHYSTVSHCSKQLTIALEPLKTQGAIHLAVDSTGLKIYGEGEWKVRQHGVGKRRTWRKLHLAVNPKNGQIESAVVTTNNFKDSELLPDLVDAIDKPITSLSGDGGYDSHACYKYLNDREKQGRQSWKQKSGYHQRSL